MTIENFPLETRLAEIRAEALDFDSQYGRERIATNLAYVLVVAERLSRALAVERELREHKERK